jgi:PRTRC genetic system protein C
MATATVLPRKFIYEAQSGNIDLPDLDPTMSPEAVLKFWSNQYRELKQADIVENLTPEAHEYRFVKIATTKGFTIDDALKGDFRQDGYIDGLYDPKLWKLHDEVASALSSYRSLSDERLVPAPSDFLGLI